MTDLHRECPLFDKLLSTQINDGIHDARNSALVFRILTGTQSTPNGQTEKLFHFEV
jgi:hypothetical protein